MIIEVANFDIQPALKTPGISGVEYQQGEQAGFWNCASTSCIGMTTSARTLTVLIWAKPNPCKSITWATGKATAATARTT